MKTNDYNKEVVCATIKQLEDDILSEKITNKSIAENIIISSFNKCQLKKTIHFDRNEGKCHDPTCFHCNNK